MPFTYDPTTDIGKIRLLIRDTSEADALFTDEDLYAFISMSDEENIKFAAADALEMIAVNQVLLYKKVKIEGALEIDGPRMAEVLMELARSFRAQAMGVDSTYLDGMFDIAEQVFDPFTYRERIRKEAMRNY